MNAEHPLAEPRRFMRFWSQVLIGDGCWEWQGSIPGGPHGGYGRCTQGLAHRAAYEFCVGPVPVGLDVELVNALDDAMRSLYPALDEMLRVRRKATAEALHMPLGACCGR